uniref:HMA domain-containing protein n=1 Tax=Oryza punctata TaxID=4537 RepID=A0A0E0KEI1_ORYPU
MDPSPAITMVPVVPLVAAARPLLAGFVRSRGFASISSLSPFSGGGGGRFFGGGGGGRGGGGDDSGAGDSAAASAAAAAALGEPETADADVIMLRVGGMSCGGCAASVKRILESQPEVTSATVDFEKKTAAVWTTPEAKATKDWQKQLGEKLAHHLSTCGFQSHLLDEEEPDSGSQQ